jgi:transposase
MKHGMDREDLAAAHRMCVDGCNATTIATTLNISTSVVEAWMPHLTKEGWGAIRKKDREERANHAMVKENISAEQAIAEAKIQLLKEDKLRADIRAEILADTAHADKKSPQEKADEGSQNERPLGEAARSAEIERQEQGPTKRRRSRN